MGEYGEVRKNGKFLATPWKDLPVDATRVIQKVKHKGKGRIDIGHHDKIRALELLIKLKGFEKPASEDNDKLDALIAVLKAGPVKRDPDGA